MSTLLLYSGGQNRANQTLHAELVRLARLRSPRRPLRLTYVPFCADGSQVFFMRAVRRYSRFGVDQFCCLNPEERPSRAQIRAALDTDIVYLAGGNTFYFLRALRASGLMPELRAFAERGGVLAGLSAGAHILSPHIELAGAPGLDPDENEVQLRDFTALGLAPFEILPHFQDTPRRVRVLREYSRMSNYPVFACPDGTGLIFENGVIRPIGRGIRVYAAGAEIGK